MVQERGCHAARYVQYNSMFMFYVPKTLCGLSSCEKKQLSSIKLFGCIIPKKLWNSRAFACTYSLISVNSYIPPRRSVCYCEEIHLYAIKMEIFTSTYCYRLHLNVRLIC